MNWHEQGIYYCERTDLTFWSEPINAVTNLAFIIAAAVMAYRLHGTKLWGGYVLVLLVAAMGVGSFMFHTFATKWAEVSDTAPIGLFILFYLYLANSRFVGLPWWAAVIATAGFFPYAYAVSPIIGDIPFIRISNFYWLVPILLVAYAAVLWRKARHTAQGLLIGAAILCVSISVRSLDLLLCDVWPIGTHPLWHIINGVMLAWMIEVYRRHMLALGRAGG
ncbi:MAG: ceramidase domain-containing protein [Planktomarina sp.]